MMKKMILPVTLATAWASTIAVDAHVAVNEDDSLNVALTQVEVVANRQWHSPMSPRRS